MKSGPTVFLAKGILSCTGCRYCLATLRRSGQDPDWQYNCTNEEADPCMGGFLGYSPDSETPKWCPFVKKPDGGYHVER